MANLMLTQQCNLNCCYCFANEFVNKKMEVMSFQAFEKSLQFLLTNPDERIGLIGGEPTLHPEFKKILVTLIESPFKSICLFTNGILLDPYLTELRNSKFQILINLNSPQNIGRLNYEKILNNIDNMLNKLYMKEQVGIGINIYAPNMDFSFVLDVLKDFKIKKLRLSVAVPNLSEKRVLNPLAYFNLMKPTVRDFIKNLLEINVVPNFDCNYIPYCLIDEDDKELFSHYKDTMNKSNVVKAYPICNPVIDILPNLQVVRCFGMSDYYKVNLSDFANVDELRRHFLLEIDALAYQILPDEKCGNCRWYRVGKCSCGCYAYRAQQMQELNNEFKNRMKKI